MARIKSLISATGVLSGKRAAFVLLGGDENFLFIDPSSFTESIDVGDIYTIVSKSNVSVIDGADETANDWLLNNTLINEGFNVDPTGKCKRIDKLTIRGLKEI